MPIAFLAAFAGSLAIHVAALLGVDLDLSGPADTPPLQAELKALPASSLPTPVAVPPAAKKPRKPKPVAAANAAATLVPVPESAEVVPEIAAEKAPSDASTAALPAAKPLLPAKGVVRFAVYKSTIAMQIGRTEQQWEFAEDGTYTLRSVTETTGLAAWLKPARIEQESRGRLVAGGLQPEHFSSLKNGRDAKENADFDWSTAAVHLSRDGSVQPIARGTQDLLSLNYQLAYLGRLEEGATLGVVTGKKYERYAVDALGEEEIEVPAGRFRTLHLRAQTETVTEIWIALEQRGLPVKIRFTDKKGESFEQVATEIGM